MIDRERLVVWLRERAASQGLVLGAVYAGLVTRVERGDFDSESNDGEGAA